MLKIERLKLPLDEVSSGTAESARVQTPQWDCAIREQAARLLRIPERELLSCRLLRRSLDARETPVWVCSAAVEVRDEAAVLRRLRDRRVSRMEPEGSYAVPAGGNLEPVPEGKPVPERKLVPEGKTVPEGKLVPERKLVPEGKTVPEGKRAADRPRPVIHRNPVIRPRPVIAGAGPAGLFAALVLASAGLRPILLEQGKPVEARREDVERFWSTGDLDRSSNVQFGEGGAGAFSDGKLNTGTRDPRHRFILEQMVSCGAPEEILIDAKPHVGTDRLYVVLQALRRRLLDLGAEIRFQTRLEDLQIRDGVLCGIVIAGPSGGGLSDGELCGVGLSGGELSGVGLSGVGLCGEGLPDVGLCGEGLPDVGLCGGQTARRSGTEALPCRQLILCPGHSARDTFAMLYRRGVPLEAKPFAVGVRIEHRQSDINAAQYREYAGRPGLPAASYKLSCHLSTGRGVFSFCVCPGGEVVGAASERDRTVTNGMSAYARDGENINGGLLVGVTPADFSWPGPEGIALDRFRADAFSRLPENSPLAGIAFQRRLEAAAFALGGGGYRAPVQRVEDFLQGRPSQGPGRVMPTYRPGVTWADLSLCLPAFITDSLREALPILGRKLRGFDQPDAVLTAVESRSSSPVRIVRDESGQSAVGGLYPCGEGAGYAGGILSAAADGMRAAERVCGELL